MPGVSTPRPVSSGEAKYCVWRCSSAAAFGESSSAARVHAAIVTAMSAAAAADIQRRLTDEGREQSLERRASDLKAFLSNLNASRRILGRMIESNRWNMA